MPVFSNKKEIATDNDSLSSAFFLRMAAANGVRVPNFTAVHAFRYPVDYRLSLTVGDVPVPLYPASSLVTLGPYNDVLGVISHQLGAPSTSNTNLPTFQGAITDPFLSTLMATQTTAAYINSGMVRCVSFCVEVANLAQLSTVGGAAHFHRWQQNGVPIVFGGNNGTCYASTVTTVFESTDTVHAAMGALTSNKCFTTNMFDRDTLAFTACNPGQTPWINRYAPPINSTGEAVKMPWHPIVLLLEAPTAATVELVVRAVYEYCPPAQSFLYKLARPLAISPPGAESLWWSRETKIAGANLIYDSLSGMTRHIGGIMGMAVGNAFAGDSGARAGQRLGAAAASHAVRGVPKMAAIVEGAINAVSRQTRNFIKGHSALPARRSLPPPGRRLRAARPAPKAAPRVRRAIRF